MSFDGILSSVCGDDRGGWTRRFGEIIPRREGWSFHPVGGTSTLYASDDMIEHIRVLEEAFGPNLPQILRQLQGGVAIVGCRVVDEVPSNATPLR